MKLITYIVYCGGFSTEMEGASPIDAAARAFLKKGPPPDACRFVKVTWGRRYSMLMTRREVERKARCLS